MKKSICILCLALGLVLLLPSVALADTAAPAANAARLPGEAGYLYCLEDGMPKYWLDTALTEWNIMTLHCFFRSGDPSWYEEEFTLDLSTATFDDDGFAVHTVTNRRGRDCSGWFESLRFRVEDGALTMSVKRNEQTLAGGGEDNILNGDYRMTAIRLGGVLEYRRESDGQLKYWLDLDGNDLRLHAMFLSEGPDYYESVFFLKDGVPVEGSNGSAFRITSVIDSHGLDVTKRFRSLVLTTDGYDLVMDVERDPATLAGGAENNILDGSYRMKRRCFPLPAGDGPFTAEELGTWAQLYYYRHTGFLPPQCDVEPSGDGFQIHLYELVWLDHQYHTATSAWYTVDAAGAGVNDITGEAVDLKAP